MVHTQFQEVAMCQIIRRGLLTCRHNLKLIRSWMLSQRVVSNAFAALVSPVLPTTVSGQYWHSAAFRTFYSTSVATLGMPAKQTIAVVQPTPDEG